MLNRFFFIPILLIVFIILFYSVYEEVKNKTIEQFNSEQLVITNAASRGISDFMIDCQSELEFLSSFDGIIDLNHQGKQLLEIYFKKSFNQIEAITRVDSQGIILATYPENNEAIGSDISYQQHVNQIIEFQEPVISDVFMAVQGYLAIAIHVPVIKEHKYNGSLAILIAIDKIGKRYLENIKIGESGYAILLSKNNIEIFSPYDKNIGSSMKELSPNEPTVDLLIHEIETKNFGSLSCFHDQSETKNLGEKQVVFSRIPMGNTYWTILTSVPVHEVYDTIKGFRNKLLLLFGIVFTVMLIYFYLFTKAKNILKEESKRKIAEKKLIESEAYNRTLFNQSPIGLALTNMEGKLIDVNDAFANIIGRTIEETLKLSYWDITPKKYKERENEQLESLENKGSYGPYEKEYIHKDGHLVPVRLQGLIIEKDGIPHIWSSVEDITESKQSELRIRESEEYFRTIFEQSASGMCITSIDGVFLQVNYPLCEMLDYSVQELKGKHFNEFTFPDDAKIGSKAVAEMLKGEKKKAIFEKRYLKKSGQPIWAHVSSALLHDKKGNPKYFITQIEDISPRMISDAKLISSENKFKALVEQSLTGIYIFEKENFIYVNKRFCEIFGYSEDEILAGMKPTDVISIEDRERADENVKRRLEGETQSVRYTAKGNHKNGKLLWVEIHGTHIQIEGKNVITGTVLDITKRREAEKEIEKLNEELEQKVIKRTEDLEHKISEIERMNKLFIDRELRMKELKEKIRVLEQKKNIPKK